MTHEETIKRIQESEETKTFIGGLLTNSSQEE